MLHRVLARTKGQSLPIVVLMLAVIFLIIGLSIDGGLLYAQRRLMQNTADAACLAAATGLSIGQTSTNAQAAAVQVINQNLGPSGPGTGANAPGTLSYASVTDVYTPTVGSGAALTRGIELSGAEVRVALSSPAFSYFMRVFGQAEYTVAARARCDATAGGGGTPFAISRWRRYTSANSTSLVYDLNTSQSLSDQLSGTNDVVRDVLAEYRNNNSDPSRVTQWPDWGTNNFPGIPGTNTGLFRSPTTPATPAAPGIEIVIAGNGANPNSGGGNSFRGPVMLDLRNVTYANPGFYSGLVPNTGVNNYKYFTSRNILDGYSGPWIPAGTQLAFTDGVGAGHIIDEFSMRYTVGQTVTVLVYNGTIYEATNFNATIPTGSNTTLSKGGAISFTGDFPPNCNALPHANQYIFEGDANGTTLSPLSQYGVRFTPVTQNGAQNVPVPFTAAVRAFSSVDGDLWNQLATQWSGNSTTGGWLGVDGQGRPTGETNFAIAASGTTLQMKLQQTETDECSYLDASLPPDPLDPTGPNVRVADFPLRPREGAVSLFLEARDIGTRLRRGRYVHANLGTSAADQNREFYAGIPGEVVFAPTELGNQAINLSQPLFLQTVGGTALRRSDLSGVAFAWFDANPDGSMQSVSAPNGITAAVTDVTTGNGANSTTTPTLQIGIATTAQTGKEYYLRIALTRQGVTKWIWYYVGVQPPMNNSNNVDQFIYTLGYASFRVTDINSNSIEGVAVSGLLDPEEVVYGMRPRLVPWQE